MSKICLITFKEHISQVLFVTSLFTQWLVSYVSNYFLV